MIKGFDKDKYIAGILKNIARNSEWAPFLATADTIKETDTGYIATYKRVGTMGVGDYYNSGKNTYRVSNEEGKTNSYVKDITIDVNIEKSSEIYYSAPAYAGFKNPGEIFDKQKDKQEKDWMRMRDIEVLTLITKGGTGKSEQATIVPVDVTSFTTGKLIRKYISAEALKIKRKGLITEDNEHVGINSSDIVIALAPQQFSLVIEDYATIDVSTFELREDIRATKVDGILVYENLYLDAELGGETDKTWMVLAVKNRLALPTAIQGTYDNKVFKADHVLGLYGVMGKGILDGSLITRFINVPGIQPDLENSNLNAKDEEINKLKSDLEKNNNQLKKLNENIKSQKEEFNQIKDSLTEKIKQLEQKATAK